MVGVNIMMFFVSSVMIINIIEIILNSMNPLSYTDVFFNGSFLRLIFFEKIFMTELTNK